LRTLAGLPKYIGDATSYARQSVAGESFPIRRRDLFLVLGEHRAEAAMFDGHYFHQDLWAARKVLEHAPAEHFDFGSRVDGFVAHLLTFMPVTVIDVRPLDEDIEGLHFIQGDATHLLGIPDASLASVSSLHAVEHFGLGRYGDPVDPRAADKVMATLSRVLAPKGRLYLSVPIGRERLMFNAHRIFSPSTVLNAMSGLELISFAAVDDSGRFHPDAEPGDFDNAVY
jgi:SAM-dependent methyltransferase